MLLSVDLQCWHQNKSRTNFPPPVDSLHLCHSQLNQSQLFLPEPTDLALSASNTTLWRQHSAGFCLDVCPPRVRVRTRWQKNFRGKFNGHVFSAEWRRTPWVDRGMLDFLFVFWLQGNVLLIMSNYFDHETRKLLM